MKKGAQMCRRKERRDSSTNSGLKLLKLQLHLGY